MQNEVVLYLENPDGEVYDIPIFEGYNVSLNFSFTDIENFKPTGTFSSTFRCPVDEDLQNFIGAIYDTNYVGWFNPKTKIPAYITANTLPFSQGHAQVMNMIHTQAGWEVELTFYGETPDIRTALGDLKLKDVTTLSDLNHVCNYDNITDDNLESGNVNYFLIDKGQNFSVNGEGGTQDIYGTTFLTALHAADFTPAVPARYLWDQIWDDAGFVIESPSNFPDVLDNYWIPFFNGTAAPVGTDPQNAELFQLRLDTANNFTTVGNGVTAFTTLTEDFDNGGNVAANVFTVPYDGLYRVRFWCTFQRNGGVGSAPQFRLELRDGSNVVNGASGWFSAPTNNPNTILVDTVRIFQAGETYTFNYRVLGAGSTGNIDIIGTAGYDTANGTGWELVEITEQFSGQTVDMVSNAPDMRQIDFITSILKLHNAVVVPDRNIPNKLRVEAMNDYLQSGNTVDWTGKLDLSKDVQIKPTNSIQSRDLEFTYTQDGDAINKYYTDSQDRTFGMLRTKDSGILTELRSDFATGEKKVEVQFAPTPCNPIPGTNLPIPKFVNEQGELFKAKPRILYHAYTASNFSVYDEDTSTITATDVRILSHFDDYDLANEEPGIDTLDLNFGAEVFPSGYLQTTFGAPYQNLFFRYYQDYIREIYDPTARIMEAYFALDINDVLNFGFNDVVFIQDSYWRILDISGYGVGLDNVTKVRLLKILSLDSECTYTPSVSNADGTVTFVDGSGSTSAGNETCCELFGYTWNGAACYWALPGAGIAPSTSGLNNFGQGVGNEAPLPSDSISFVSRSTIQSNNFGARYGGDLIESGQNNLGALMHGTRLTASDDLGGILVNGENADVTLFGSHFGGGYNDGDIETTQGRAQFGSIPLLGSGTLVNIGDSFEVMIRGAERIVIPDETTWSAKVYVALQHYNVATSAIDKYQVQEYFLTLYKANNTAGVIAAQIGPNNEDGNMNAHFDLAIDVATDTTQHRLSVKATATGSLPSGALDASVLVIYNQVKE